MSGGYPGPLRDEPIAVELYNTLYSDGGRLVDGLADTPTRQAWIEGIGRRLPAVVARAPSKAELAELRDAVRQSFEAVVAGSHPPRGAVEGINGFSTRVRRAPAIGWGPDGAPYRDDHVDADKPSDLVLGSIAADAVEVLTGPMRGQLRACGAPGCVLMFVKQHTRREWCSAACGNRARQARHYRRIKAQARAPEAH
jgi:predicted RNA-binding Zn ribbon-like protein